MLVKICGITREEDAQHAVRAGATAIGMIFWPRSPRFVSFDRAASIVAAVPPTVMTVGVFVDEPLDVVRRAVEETGITTVQLHGSEPVAYAEAIGVPVLRSVTLDTVESATVTWPAGTRFLLDAADPVRRGGTGTAVDWARAAVLAQSRRVILAGGLTPENVAEAIGIVRPFGVDVSSGVETAPGVKDLDKVTEFIARARSANGASGGAVVERR